MIKDCVFRNIKKRQDECNFLLKGKENAIVFDTETTGIVKRGNGVKEEDIKIIQFSAILYDLSWEDDTHVHFEQKDYLNFYINPEELISQVVSDLTGITNEMVANADTENVAAEKIAKFMSRSNLWIAYNTPYDLKRLQVMAERTGVDIPLPGKTDGLVAFDLLPITRDTVDPEAIAAFKKENKIKKGMYKLDILTPMLLPDFKASFHNSLDDVRSTAALMEFIYPEFMSLKSENGTVKFNVYKFSYGIGNIYSPHKSRRIIVYVKKENMDSETLAEDCGVYWDVDASVWSCKAEMKKMFKHIDIADLERQVLELAEREGYTDTNEYITLSMDTIPYEAAYRWSKTSSGKNFADRLKKTGQIKKCMATIKEFDGLFSGIILE